MLYDPAKLLARANEFLSPSGRSLGTPLGSGRDGIVWTVESQSQNRSSDRTAVKAHANLSSYQRERDVYLRLRTLEIEKIRSCHVPQLVEISDEFMVIEITIVARPFVLDFADAYLDRPPTFDEDVLEEWRADKAEQFGSRWPEVQRVLRALEVIGIHMTDVKPGNIES